MSNGAPEPPSFPGEVLRQHQRQRQWQLLARNADEGSIAALRADQSVGAVEVRTPSLEEIFVSVMGQDDSEVSATQAEATS